MINFVNYFLVNKSFVGLNGSKIPELYFETAAFLITFVILGKWLEAKAKGEVKVEEQSLTTKDALALVNAKVSNEDYDEVIRVSKVLGKTIGEALKDKTMLTILNERVEERRTAEATLIGKQKRGSSKNTGEDILDKAEKTGEVPEDEEGMQKLFQARMARKTKG